LAQLWLSSDTNCHPQAYEGSGQYECDEQAGAAAHKRNMMHVTLHLDSTAHPEGSQAA